MAGSGVRVAAASALLCGLLVLAAMEIHKTESALESDPFGDNAFWARARASSKLSSQAEEHDGRGVQPHPPTFREPTPEDPARNSRVNQVAPSEQPATQGYNDAASTHDADADEVVVIHGGYPEEQDNRDVVVRTADPAPERKPVVVRGAEQDHPDRKPVVIRSADDGHPNRRPVVVRDVSAPDGTDMPLDSRVDAAEDRLDDLERQVGALQRHQSQLHRAQVALEHAAARQSRVAVQQQRTAEREAEVAEHQRKVAETQANIAAIERDLARSAHASHTPDHTGARKAHVHVHVEHHHGVNVDVQAARSSAQPDKEKE